MVSYILSIREIKGLSELAQENLASVQETQKQWYDRTAWTRSFEPRDQVLVLLPTSTKLEAKWQGPYLVEKHVGKVDYHVKMHDRKKNSIFHVNMLQKWNAREPCVDSFLCDEILPDDIPV